MRATGVGSLLAARPRGVAVLCDAVLKLQIATGCPEQVTVFDDLGFCRLLAETSNIGAVEAFNHRWLGALLDYDTGKGTAGRDPVQLSGARRNYDQTATALVLHRSALRYRLQRIREVSGHDLNHPDTRFNLQLATRAWKTMHATHQQP